MVIDDSKNHRSEELEVLVEYPTMLRANRSTTQPIQNSDNPFAEEDEKDLKILENICISLGIIFPEPNTATLAAAVEFEEILAAVIMKQTEYSSQEDALSIIEDVILADKDQLNELIKAAEEYENEETMTGKSLVLENFNLNRYKFIITNFIEGKFKNALNSKQIMQIIKFVMELFKRTMKVSFNFNINANEIKKEFEENGGKHLCCSDKKSCKCETGAAWTDINVNPIPLMDNTELSMYLEIFQN